MLQAFGKLVQRFLLVDTAGKRFLRFLANGDVVLDANGVEEATLRIAHARGGDRSPEVAAVFSPDAPFDAVSVDFPGDLVLKLRVIALDVLRGGFIEDRTSHQLPRRISHQRRELRIDAQEPTFGVDLDDADPGMLVSRAEPLFVSSQQFFAARAVGHVDGDGTRVDQLPVGQPRGRGDEHIPDRSVLGAQACRDLVDLLVAAQAREDVVDRVPVDVELTDVPADVVLRRIAQQLQLGAIGAQNRALGGEQIQPYGGILEKLV